ncbi:MAG: 50S ribosomal protein L4 [bacterium]|nr:50S ribosomal protein L4 [bacterium]
MANVDIYDTNGKVIGKISLPEEYFGAKLNPALLSQAIRVYLSNQRSAQPQVKTRSDVDLTKAKWFRQKGTGRARHGSKSAPIFVGGGVAHGPTGDQNWQRKMPKRMRKVALANALTSKLHDKNLIIITGLEKINGKTKDLAKILSPYQLKARKGRKNLLLLILPKKSENIVQAGRNIERVNVRPVDLLNAYEVLQANKILITPEAVEYFKQP